MPTPRPIAAHIAEAPLKGLLLRVTILCCLKLAIEGMDTNAIAYVGPLLSKDYHIPIALVGWIYTGTVVSSLIGAAGVAPLCDLIGRRTILVVASLILALATGLTPLAHTFPVLMAVRVIVGIAFGAAVPCAFALTADYSPANRRSLLIMITTSGVGLGSVFTGLIASVVITKLGWPWLMYVVGALSFGVTLLLMSSLPESLTFLLHRRPNSPAIGKMLAQMGIDPAMVAPTPAPERGGASLPVLFGQGRAAMTTAILVIIVCAYVVEFFLSYWQPAMLMHAGAHVRSASLVTAAGKTASIGGAVIVGLCMDRFGQRPTLAKSFLAAAVVIGVLSVSTGNPAFAVCMVVATNFFVDGSFAGSQALVASSYPSHIRGTATGWIGGLGRLIGGGTGTAAGGLSACGGLDDGPDDRLARGRHGRGRDRHRGADPRQPRAGRRRARRSGGRVGGRLRARGAPSHGARTSNP